MAQDFSSPVTYRVTAGNSGSIDYTVLVTGSAATAISGFVFAAANNSGLTADVTATVTANLITATVPAGTAVTALVPTITLSEGAAVSPASGVAKDFSSLVTYRVTAADAVTTADYTVLVTFTGSADAAITALTFTAATNSVLSSDVAGSISGTAITALFPLGTALTALAPTLTISSGATVSPASGAAQDFSHAVTYRVTAQDGASTTDYTVLATTVADTMAPVVGGLGSLTYRPTDATSMSISWTKATDDLYAQNALQYKVVRSSSDNIQNAADAGANGTLVMDWATDVATTSVTGLTAGARYWFNVLVRDGAGHVSAYDSTATEMLTRVAAGTWVYPDYGGYSVAISADGSTLVAGAPGETASVTGKVCVFEKQSGTWTRVATLTPSNSSANDGFGWSVAVSGTGATVAVGAPRADYWDTDRGAVLMYDRPTGGWASTSAEDKALQYALASAYSGYAVALSADGNTVAYGVPGADNTQTDQGMVTVSVRQTSAWSGVVDTYLLWASDAFTSDALGDSISICAGGSTIAAGAVYADPGGTNRGAVYVFVKPMTGWANGATQDVKLTRSGGADGDCLGNSVAISPNGFVIAADASEATSQTGAVCIYVRLDGQWSLHATGQDSELASPTGLATGDYLGWGLSFSYDASVLAVGACGDAISGDNQGSVYLYSGTNGVYGSSPSKLYEVSTGSESDLFGYCVSLNTDGTLLAVGVPGEDTVASDAGAVYMFDF